MFDFSTLLQSTTFDPMKVFESCPIIYSILFLMSFASFIIWLYTTLTLRLSDMMSEQFMKNATQCIKKREYQNLLALCDDEKSFSSKVVHAGVSARKHGLSMMMEMMEKEGKRQGNLIWQRISILNEIAVIAPMLGLLGTVWGLFFAFYNLNRTQESLSTLFDGLGIAIGTTVLGLIVAIIAMVFYTLLKFRLVKILHSIENESLSLISLVEDS